MSAPAPDTDRPNLIVSVRADLINNRPTLVVEVENRTARTLTETRVRWVTAHPSPPVPADGVSVVAVGGTVEFVRVRGPADLPPGGRSVHALPSVVLPAVRSEADALSVEEFGVAVVCDGHECYRIPGQVAAVLLDQAERGPPVAAGLTGGVLAAFGPVK